MLASLEGNRRQIAQGVEIGQQRRRLRTSSRVATTTRVTAARYDHLARDRIKEASRGAWPNRPFGKCRLTLYTCKG